MNTLIYIPVLLLLLFILYLLLIHAEPGGKERADFLLGKNIAHRGLFNNERGVPENSIQAAKESVQCGFGMEFDVQLSRDGKLVIFHDETVDRMTGGHGRVGDMTYEKLSKLSLLGTNQGIPTLDRFLQIADGKVPLIIELKPYGNVQELCRLAADQLDTYKGPFVVESFSPAVVAWFRKNRPAYIRGQLACKLSHEEGGLLSSFALANLLSNFYTRPHFIAYRHSEAKNLSFRLCRHFGAMTVAWTVKTLDDYKQATEIFDCIIFERILPANTYSLAAEPASAIRLPNEPAMKSQVNKPGDKCK